MPRHYTLLLAIIIIALLQIPPPILCTGFNRITQNSSSMGYFKDYILYLKSPDRSSYIVYAEYIYRGFSDKAYIEYSLKSKPYYIGYEEFYSAGELVLRRDEILYYVGYHVTRDGVEAFIDIYNMTSENVVYSSTKTLDLDLLHMHRYRIGYSRGENNVYSITYYVDGEIVWVLLGSKIGILRSKPPNILAVVAFGRAIPGPIYEIWVDELDVAADDTVILHGSYSPYEEYSIRLSGNASYEIIRLEEKRVELNVLPPISVEVVVGSPSGDTYSLKPMEYLGEHRLSSTIDVDSSMNNRVLSIVFRVREYGLYDFKIVDMETTDTELITVYIDENSSDQIFYLGSRLDLGSGSRVFTIIDNITGYAVIDLKNPYAKYTKVLINNIEIKDSNTPALIEKGSYTIKVCSYEYCISKIVDIDKDYVVLGIIQINVVHFPIPYKLYVENIKVETNKLYLLNNTVYKVKVYYPSTRYTVSYTINTSINTSIKIPYSKLTIKTNRGAVITIDNKPLIIAGNTTLYIEPGKHTLEYRGREKELGLNPWNHTIIEIKLKKNPMRYNYSLEETEIKDPLLLQTITILAILVFIVITIVITHILLHKKT